MERIQRVAKSTLLLKYIFYDVYSCYETANCIVLETLTWSLEGVPPEGLWISEQSGRIHWDDPIHSEFQYVIYVRATNSAGYDTAIMYIGVEESGPCPADLNEDGVVSTNDLLIMIAWWGETNPLIDIDGSGVVDTGDILLLLSGFGSCA